MRRLVVLACAVVLVDTAFFAAITPLLPYYSDRLSLSKTAAGVLTGAYPAGTLLASLPAGWFAARAGVKPAMLLGLAGQVDVAPSCSLLHVPLDVTLERDLDPLVARWLAFAPFTTSGVVASYA